MAANLSLSLDFSRHARVEGKSEASPVVGCVSPVFLTLRQVIFCAHPSGSLHLSDRRFLLLSR